MSARHPFPLSVVPLESQPGIHAWCSDAACLIDIVVKISSKARLMHRQQVLGEACNMGRMFSEAIFCFILQCIHVGTLVMRRLHSSLPPLQTRRFRIYEANIQCFITVASGYHENYKVQQWYTW